MNIYDYIQSEEKNFDRPIDINGWEWCFRDHIKTSFFYKYGRLLNGNDEDTPVKNITKPLLELQYQAEDIDVKDCIIYVDDPANSHLSFLVKKYHDEIFVQKYDLDTFFNELNESKIDYGLGLIKRIDGVRPDNVPLQSIAFCDQTDILSGPICIKHFYNPQQLKDMEESGWGDEKNGANITINELIDLAESTKKSNETDVVKISTPGKFIEIYELHGVLPIEYLEDSQPGLDTKKYKNQIQIVAFYKNQEGGKTGVTLFRKEEKESPFEILKRDELFSRCAGFGGAEELFEPQVWTNYDVIRQKNLLDASTTIVLKSIGAGLKSRYPNGLSGVGNLEIIDLNPGEDLAQVDTMPRSMTMIDNDISKWEAHAQRTSGASNALLGESPTSGTPFKLQDAVIQQGQTKHEYRRKKYAKLIEKLYKNWFIPYIQSEIVKDNNFLAELTYEEMKFIASNIAKKEANRIVVDRIIAGKNPTQEEYDTIVKEVEQDFLSKGNRHFIKILKGEFDKKPLKVRVNVAGKQKDLAKMTDKLTNIFRFIFSNPQGFQQVMQIPGMADSFNKILEFSGLSSVYFNQVKDLNPTPMDTASPEATQQVSSQLLTNQQQ